jgi:hypothetical protein
VYTSMPVDSAVDPFLTMFRDNPFWLVEQQDQV